MDAVSVPNVSTAVATQKYAMQMWVFFHNFDGFEFKGVRAIWDKHNKIEIREATGNYFFDCYPHFVIGGGALNATFESMAITANTWNFLHCATDVNGESFIMKSNFLIKSHTLLAVPAFAPGATTTFELSDLSTKVYGHLYIKQIRLWADAFAECVHRVLLFK